MSQRCLRIKIIISISINNMLVLPLRQAIYMFIIPMRNQVHCYAATGRGRGGWKGLGEGLN